MTSIYGLYDPRVNSIRYVGKTSMKIGKRLSCHISAAKAIKDLKKASMVNCWMHKLLKEGVRPQIRLLEVCDETIEDYLEIEWIANMRLCGGPKMLNGTDGGEGGRWTEEAKAKASKTHTEMWQDPEYRENHIAAYGDRSQHAPYPDDFGVNASRINKERWADPEYRERMCEAFQNRAKKTHCSRGHEYNEENTYTDPDTGWRHCRICRREDQNRKYAEMRAANPLPPREHVTRCAQGHEYTEENTYVDPKTGDRHCRICRRANDNKRYAQKKMQAGEDTSGLKGNDSL